MKELFPILKYGQVALSRADSNTGIVLNDQNKYAINSSQNAYITFNSLPEALNAAKLIINENRSVECYIHDDSNNLLSFLTFEDITLT